MRCNTGVSAIDKEGSLTALQAACEPGASILVDKNPRQVRTNIRNDECNTSQTPKKSERRPGIRPPTSWIGASTRYLPCKVYPDSGRKAKWYTQIYQ